MSPASCFVLFTFLVACGCSKATPSNDAPPAPSSGAVASAESATPVSSTAPPAATSAEMAEATPDAGRAHRRHRADGGGALAAGSASGIPAGSAYAPETPSPSPPARNGKSSMGNDEPYGPAQASASPALRKQPLPSDDPWEKK